MITRCVPTGITQELRSREEAALALPVRRGLSRDVVLTRRLVALMSPGIRQHRSTGLDEILTVAVCDAVRKADETSVHTILTGLPWEKT
jgi:hypothetical protein